MQDDDTRPDTLRVPGGSLQARVLRRFIEKTEEEAGPPPAIGTDWDNRLAEWLEAVLNPSGLPVQDYCFPTEALRDEYLATIAERPETEVGRLLRLFIFDQCAFELADTMALTAIKERAASARRPLQEVASSEYERRLLRWMAGGGLPHPGARWALDLLPDFPREALAAIDAYLLSAFVYLPDGRISGLYDGLALIRARYIGAPDDAEEQRLALLEMTPRQFEMLVDRLYTSLGYATQLTPPGSDGGRDVIAERTDAGRRESIRVECKLHTGPVGVEIARQLLGVVSHERANRGVLVTSSRFTRGASRLASSNHMLELIDGRELVVLLNENFGKNWPARIEWLLQPLGAEGST